MDLREIIQIPFLLNIPIIFIGNFKLKFITIQRFMQEIKE
jgi:hypothetical protein